MPALCKVPHSFRSLEDRTLRRAFYWVQRPRRDLLGIRPRAWGVLYLTSQNREGEPEQVPGIIYN
jgi:hypothetical protein